MYMYFLYNMLHYIANYTYIFMFSECRQLVTPLVRNQGLDSPNALHSKTLNKTTISHKTVTIKTIRASPNVMIQKMTVAQ